MLNATVRFLRLRLEGGPMRGAWAFAPDGATLIAAPAAARQVIREAIVFALYGGPEAPVAEAAAGAGAGGAVRVILECEADGERHTIARPLDGSGPEGALAGGRTAPGSTGPPGGAGPAGARLLGLTRAEFGRWILGDAALEPAAPSPGVLRHLERVGRAAASGVGASAALAALRQALQSGAGEEAAEREALAEIDGELEALAHLRRAMDEEALRLRVLERRGRALEVELARGRADQLRQEATALRAALSADEGRRARLRELEAERLTLEPVALESRVGREQVIQWQAEAALLEREIDRLSRRLAIVQGEAESIAAELGLPRLVKAGPFARQDLDRLVAGLADLRQRQGDREDAVRRLEDERRHLAARGFPFPWYETLTRQFGDLDAEASRELLAAREALVQADRRIATLRQALGLPGQPGGPPGGRGGLLHRARQALGGARLSGPDPSDRLRAEVERLEDERRATLARVERLGRGPTRGRELLEQFATYHDLRGEAERHRTLQAHAAGADAQSARALEALGALLARCGDAEASVEAAEALIQAIRERLALEDEARRAAGEVRRLTEEIERQRGEVILRKRRAAGAAGPDGEAGEASFEAILLRVDRIEEQRRRYVVLVQGEIPPLRASLLTAPALAEVSARLQAIDHALGPEGAGAVGERVSSAELDGMQEQARALRDEAEGVQLTLARADETYRERVPALRGERAAVAGRLARLEERAAAVRLAAAAIEAALAEEPTWVASLRQQTQPLVPALLPGFDDARFDRQLRLSLIDRHHGRRLDPTALARPGSGEDLAGSLALLAALGVGRTLAAGGVRWPLLLNEPFAAADDATFRAGLALLLGPIARERQVILLSGHAARLRWLEAEAPEILQGVARLRAESPAVLS